MKQTIKKGNYMQGAIFDISMKYRFALWRMLKTKSEAPNPKLMTWIGLNPSTADHKRLDPTTRRCIKYAKEWGYDGYVMLNAFSVRSTEPSGIRTFVPNTIREINDYIIKTTVRKSSLIIACWGNHATYENRSKELKEVILANYSLWCISVNKSGEPKHPLYTKNMSGPDELILFKQGDDNARLKGTHSTISV